MTTPRVEHISANINTAIAAITTDNGFNQNLTPLRPPRNDFRDTAPANGLVLIKQGPTTREPDAVNKIAWRQNYELAAFVINSDATSTAIDTRINQVRSDIEKKLMEDETRGGYAYETQLVGFDDIPADQGISGVQISVDVYYRTKYGDPYTA